MSAGIFSNIGTSYIKAGKNTFYFTKRAPFLLKPFALVFALFYSVILLIIGLFFYSLIILDWLGNLTDTLRKGLLNAMDRQRWKITNGILSFIFSPIIIVLLSPLLLLSVFIPKLSSNPAADFVVNEISDIFSGAGAFKRINKIIWGAAKRLFRYVGNANLILMPILAIIAILYSIVLIAVGSIFAILIPLDWISYLIESIRQGIVSFTNNQQQKIRYSGSSFLIAPVLLAILAPIFLLLLIIPKFTTQLDAEV